MIKLSVIILNFNTQEYLNRCLQSIKEQTVNTQGNELEVIVVDNGSTDDSFDMVSKKFPKVKIIKNKENLGFSKANNKAIKQSKGEIVLLLNSDTLVSENSLDHMVNFMDSNEEIGAATARLQLADGGLDLACHRGFPTPWNAFTYFSRLEQLFPNLSIFSGYHQTWKDFNKPHEVDAISGACFFIKRKVIDEVGLLDERFFMYAEDLDWCMRIKKAGWKIYYNPNATIIHFKKRSGRKKKEGEKISKSDKKLRSETIGHFYETMEVFYDKHYKARYPKWVRSLVLAGIWGLDKIKLIHNRFL